MTGVNIQCNNILVEFVPLEEIGIVHVHLNGPTDGEAFDRFVDIFAIFAIELEVVGLMM